MGQGERYGHGDNHEIPHAAPLPGGRRREG